MRRSLICSWLLVAAQVGCSATQANPVAQDPKPLPAETKEVAKPELGALIGPAEVVAAERELALADDAKVTIPAGWKLEPRSGGMTATDPEGDLTITMLAFESASAKAAKDQLLSYLQRSAKAGPVEEKSLTDEGGWDEIYEFVQLPPSPGERIFIVNARRIGGRVVATLLEGSPAAFNRRGAQLKQIVFGLAMKGVEEEDLSKREAHPLEGERKAAFEAAIDEIKTRTGAPAVAVAVVRDGKQVFVRAVGKKRVDGEAPVTEKTPFMIGSVSKSLSTLLIAKLVDDGQLRWDTKVKELLPSFATGEPSFTERLTIADTFCACTGMPRRDLELVFEFKGVKPTAVFDGFKDQKPTTAFGETFQYSNQMTALGGFLAARKASPGEPAKAYAEAMRKHVFEPMGMTRTTADFALGSKDSAWPHSASLLDEPAQKRLLPIDMERFVVPYAPAGAIFASVEDMGRYAMVELANGVTPEGKRVFSESNLLERRKPRTKASATASYGLGLAASRQKGLAVVSHDGGTFGFSSRFMLFPERNMGLVILTNGGDSDLLEAIAGRFMEIVFDQKPSALKSLDRSLSEAKTQLEKMRKDDLGKVPEEVVSRLAGRLENPQLGVITIVKGTDFPTLDAGEWKSRFGYKKDGDKETLTLIDAPGGGLPLRLEGSELVIDFGQSAYRFKRAK